MGQSEESVLPRFRGLSVRESQISEQRMRLRAELPHGWASDVAAEVAVDLIAPLADHARLRPVLLKMFNDLSEQLSLEAAAKIVSLAPKSFSKFFPRETGFYFCSWDRELRIRIATYLLHASDSSIDSIGRAVGYSDQTTFGRAFKKCHGIAATVYRRSQSFAANATVRVVGRAGRLHIVNRRVR